MLLYIETSSSRNNVNQLSVGVLEKILRGFVVETNLTCRVVSILRWPSCPPTTTCHFAIISRTRLYVTLDCIINCIRHPFLTLITTHRVLHGTPYSAKVKYDTSLRGEKPLQRQTVHSLPPLGMAGPNGQRYHNSYLMKKRHQFRRTCCRVFFIEAFL